MYIITTNIKAISIHGKSFILSIKYNVFFPKIRKPLSSMFKKIYGTCSKFIFRMFEFYVTQ